jgi:uncharacterized protein (AIM24 family)
MASTITAGNATNGLALSCDNTGILELKTGTGAGTTAMTIDASQNVTLATGIAGDFKMNSGYGSVATAYGCRAWVNFNGTGTVAIRASGNVSSITDNGAGDYTVNFTTAMPDINYSVVANSSAVYATYFSGGANINTGTVSATEFAPTTTATRFQLYYLTGGVSDAKYVNVSVFR